jgi:hypothetical protein
MISQSKDLRIKGEIYKLVLKPVFMHLEILNLSPPTDSED